MKCIVKEIFYDKNDINRGYVPGDVVDWDDKERIDDCVERGLIEICYMEFPTEDTSEQKPVQRKKKTGKKNDSE